MDRMPQLPTQNYDIKPNAELNFDPAYIHTDEYKTAINKIVTSTHRTDMKTKWVLRWTVAIVILTVILILLTVFLIKLELTKK